MFKSPRPDQLFQGDRTSFPVPFRFWITWLDNLLANRPLFLVKSEITFGRDAAHFGQDAVGSTASHVAGISGPADPTEVT